MGHGKLDSNSELDCTKSEKVKPGQNTEHPAVSPVLWNQFFPSINFTEILHLLPGLPPVRDFQYENLRISLNAMIGAKKVGKILQYLAPARSRARKLFIQISNLFPPFNACWHINSQACQTHKFKNENKSNIFQNRLQRLSYLWDGYEFFEGTIASNGFATT